MGGPRAAVLGKPIGHSLSPVIHNAGYAAAALEGWNYSAHECDEAGLAPFVAGLGADWTGLSLTMPLKAAAIDVAAEITPVVAALGAANTLVRRPDGTWRAENTDAPGMVDALRAAGVVSAARVSILGGGGTARAALAAARDLGAPVVTVYTRRPGVIDELARVSAELGIRMVGGEWARAAEAGDADVIISTVPKGIADALAGPLGAGPSGPAGSAVPAAIAWRPGTVVFDAIYDPWPTPLAAAAQRAGCRIVSGLDLLLAQAVRQFELFTGVTAPVAAMRSALRSAAADRA